MNKQIEEISCKRCVHYEVCRFVNALAVANVVNAENCRMFKDTKGYRKASDVAAVAIDKFRDAITDVFIDMCCGNDYNKVTLLQIGDAIDAVYDKQIAELYESEGAE